MDRRRSSRNEVCHFPSNELAANDPYRYSGVDTLDEPITTTMVRTVLSFRFTSSRDDDE